MGSRRIRFNQTNDRGKFVLQHKMASRCEKEETLDKMFETMADRYKWRYHKDGFVRIVPTRRRYRDDAPMAFIEFIDREGEIYKAKPQEENAHWYKEKEYKPIHKYRKQLLLSASGGAAQDTETDSEDEEDAMEKLE